MKAWATQKLRSVSTQAEKELEVHSHSFLLVELEGMDACMVKSTFSVLFNEMLYLTALLPNPAITILPDEELTIEVENLMVYGEPELTQSNPILVELLVEREMESPDEFRT